MNKNKEAHDEQLLNHMSFGLKFIDVCLDLGIQQHKHVHVNNDNINNNIAEDIISCGNKRQK